MVVELRAVQDEVDGRLDAYIEGRRVALLRAKKVDDALKILVFPDPGTEYSVEDMVGLLDQLAAHARGEGASRLVFSSPSVLIRALARRRGYEGGLRDPLVIGLDRLPRQKPTEDQGNDADGRYHGDLAEALSDFGLRATTGRRGNPLSRLGNRLARGVLASIEVSVEWLPGRSFSLALPDRSDLMEEAVARCADTAASILRRFQPSARLVREIVFDRSDRGLIEGTQGGHARGQAHTVHLNIAYCAAYAALELRRMVRGSSTDGAPTGGSVCSTPQSMPLWRTRSGTSSRTTSR